MGDEVEILIDIIPSDDEEYASTHPRERGSKRPRMQVGIRRRVIIPPREEGEGPIIITLSSDDDEEEEEEEVSNVPKEVLPLTTQNVDVNGPISPPIPEDLKPGPSSENELDQVVNEQPVSTVDEAVSLLKRLENVETNLQGEKEKNEESEVKIKMLENEMRAKEREIYVLNCSKDLFWNQKLSLHRQLENMETEKILMERKYNELLRKKQQEEDVPGPSNESGIGGSNKQPPSFVKRNLSKETQTEHQFPGGVEAEAVEDGEQPEKKRTKVIPPNSSNKEKVMACVGLEKNRDISPKPHQQRKEQKSKKKETAGEDAERVKCEQCGMTFNVKSDRGIRAYNAHVKKHARKDM